MDYKRIVDAVFHEDPTLPCTLIYDNGRTKVYQIGTSDPLIVRVLKGDASSYQFQATLLEAVATRDNLSARILYWETKEIENQAYGIQVQTYIPGKPIESYPTGEQSQAIIQAVYHLQQRLCMVTSKVKTDSIQSIHNIIQQRYSLVKDCPIKESAAKLLEQKRYLELISQSKQCVIHGDLWYKNIHLEQIANQIDARFIDFEPLILGPKILQPAILFSSYFLLSALLFEPTRLNLFNLDELLSYWPAPLNKDDILLMMLVFPIALGLLKEFRFSRDPNTDPGTHQLDMEPFEKSIQIIKKISGLA
jgi:Ser/Thr protein kinase RdoA (MazF antagonist)